MEKIDLRTATKETKEDIRKRAIRMLKQGHKQSEVAPGIQTTESTGQKDLKKKPGGTKRAKAGYCPPCRKKRFNI